MKKKLLSIFLAVLMSLSLAVPAFAAKIEEEAQAGFMVAVEQARKWFVQNYSEFYDMRNVTATLVRTFENSTEVRYTAALSCETKLKVDDIADLPFVKGLYAERDSMAAQATTTAAKERAIAATAAIDGYMVELADSASIGEYSDLAVDVVLVQDKNNKNAPLKMYYQDGMETTLYDVEVMELDADKMYEEGCTTAQELSATASTNGVVTFGYSGYNRTAARDYALKWSSNPTTCYDDVKSCGYMQARHLWNNSVYPYNSIFKHNDCADFVSQAMAAGGLPQGGT